MKTLITAPLVVVLACGLASAATPAKKKVWFEIAESADFALGVKAEPIRITSTSGENEASTIVQIRDKKKGLVSYKEWSIPTAHCRQGYGTLVSRNLDGSNRITNNYVQDGESLLAVVGTEICSEFRRSEQVAREKQLRCERELSDARQHVERAEARNTGSIDDVAEVVAAHTDLALTAYECEADS